MSDRVETTVPPIPADPWEGHPLREEVARLREELMRCGLLAVSNRQDGCVNKTAAERIREIALRNCCWPFQYCDECTHELDGDGDCFECGTGKHAQDCKCGKGDWLCPWQQRDEACQGAGEETG